MRDDVPDALDPLRESTRILGPDGSAFETAEHASAWATVAAALALQSIAASLIRLTTSDPIRHNPGHPATGAPETGTQTSGGGLSR